MGTDYYFVKRIYHDLRAGENILVVSLESGFYNLYWHFRKDEAEAKRELSFHELHSESDWDLMAKLRISHYWSQVDNEKQQRV